MLHVAYRPVLDPHSAGTTSKTHQNSTIAIPVPGDYDNTMLFLSFNTLTHMLCTVMMMLLLACFFNLSVILILTVQILNGDLAERFICSS